MLNIKISVKVLMGIDAVKNKFNATTGKKILEFEKTKTIESVYKKHIEMADGFYANKNYSLSYFHYVISLKTLALLFLQKKMGSVGEIDQSDALKLVGRKYLDLDEKKIEEFSQTYHAIINREKISRNKCKELRDIVKSAEKKV